MSKQVFKTLVKKDQNKYSCNDYVLGRISGFMEVLCNEPNEKAYAMYEGDIGHILLTECTQEQYDRFTRIVDRHYAGLCEFNYDIEL